MLGLTAALGLIMFSISVIVMWWRRRKEGALGAPLPIGKPHWSFALVAPIVALAIYLPEMAISLALVLLLEKIVFSRMPAVSRWLGLARRDCPRLNGLSLLNRIWNRFLCRSDNVHVL